MNGGGIQRRTAMARLGLTALAPFAALGMPLGGAGAARRGVAVPSGAFRLERILTRDLAGGAAIVVTRGWRIAFAGDDAGMMVSGEQTFADVAAPPALAALADIERSRSASEVFPLALDGAGLIRSSSRDLNGAPLVRALETGRALVHSLPLVAADRRDAHSFMAQLAGLSAGAVSRMPRDLFFPQPGRDTTTRVIALPGGGAGSIAVISSASAAADTGLLVTSERRIVTRIEDSERNASERWTLTRP